MSVPEVRGFIDDKLAIEMIQHLFEQPQITAALVLTMSSALVLAQVLEEEGIQSSVRGCAFSYANEPSGPQDLAALTAVLFKDKIVPLYGQVGWVGCNAPNPRLIWILRTQRWSLYPWRKSWKML